MVIPGLISVLFCINAERGLIDFDEVDFGWIIAESIKREKEWYKGSALNVGKLFMFAPISAAVGYLVSELDKLEQAVNFKEISEYTEYFLENSTPEDTVNLVKVLHQEKINLPIDNLLGDRSLHETVESILAEEINLLDFYQKFKDEYLVFKEISTNFETCNTIGFHAFYEVINENLSYNEAILHTYISILSKHFDSYLLQYSGRIKANKISQQARYILEDGSVFTEEGRNKLYELNEYVLKHHSEIQFSSVDDLTTTVTFFATLSGIRP